MTTADVPPTMRIFVGIKAAPDIADALVGLAQDLDRSPSTRLVARADVHITLVPPWNETLVSAATEKIRAVADEFEPFTLVYQHIGYGPQPQRPRLLWAECAAAEQLAALRAELLRVCGQTDERPFRPHATVARFRQNGRAVARRSPIDRALSLTQYVDSITLFRSPPPGAKGYQSLASLRLGRAEPARQS